MEELIKTVYVCEYCKKKYFRKHAAIQHEELCNSNPKNHSVCSICIHIEKIKIDVEYQNHEYGGVDIKQATAFYCPIKNKKLYPLIVRKKKLPERFPETFDDQEPMPTECNDLKLF